MKISSLTFLPPDQMPNVWKSD